VSAFRTICTKLDSLSVRLEHIVAWVPLIMAVLTVAVVILRYGFGVGAIAAQESVIYLHSALFMLGASCTLLADEHVRVDVFYRNFSRRAKAWVNGLGHVVFTLPLCSVIALASLHYVTESWAAMESSPEPGGIPAVFLLKSLIPLMAALLASQALAEVCRSLSILIEESANA